MSSAYFKQVLSRDLQCSATNLLPPDIGGAVQARVFVVTTKIWTK